MDKSNTAPRPTADSMRKGAKVESKSGQTHEQLSLLEQILMLDPSLAANVYLQLLLSEFEVERLVDSPLASREETLENVDDLSKTLAPPAAGDSISLSSALGTDPIINFTNSQGQTDLGYNTQPDFQTFTYTTTNEFSSMVSGIINQLLPTPIPFTPAPPSPNAAAAIGTANVALSESNAAISTGGILTISDPDSPASFVAQNNVAGMYGVFNINVDGIWTYAANSAFDNLNVGDNLSDTFVVQSVDGTTSTVTVIINGTNDAAVLSSATVALAETNAALSTGGTLTISDVDSPTTFVAQTNVAGSNGVFNIGTNGAWTYVANSAFNNLNVGQSVSDSFTVQSADGTTSAVQVTINGTNDAAVLSSATVALAETNAALSTGGTLTISDVDSPTTFVAQTNVVGSNGVFNIGTNGAWTYVANSALNNLSSGQSVSDQFNVTSADGTVTTVQVTINGTNDAAVLSSATVALAETNAALSTGGTLTIGDVDSPTTFVAQTNVAGSNGVFNIGTNGAWTYVANNAFNNLNVGQSVSDSFTVQSADGTTSAVTVTINGTNDAPVAQVDVSTVIEGAILNIPTNVLTNDSDVDSTISVSQFAQNSAGNGAVAANGTNIITTALGGTVLMNANGTYTYTAPTLNHTSGNTITDSFFYKAGDGSATSAWTQVSVSVTDTAPIASADADNVGIGGRIYGNVITGSGGSGTGADTIGADATQVSSVVYNGTTYSTFTGGNLTINAAHGTLVINQNGSYNYLSIETLTSAGAASTMASWTNQGIQPLGYGLGVAVFVTSLTPSLRSNYGLFINSAGGSDDSNELDSNSTALTETLVLNMGVDYRSLQATFRDVQSDDQIGWRTYDSNRVLVDSGVINNTATGTGSRNEASFTINSDGAFRYIAFYGTDANDDFTLWSITNGVKVVTPDIFTYTIRDADNDTSTANLTIAHQPVITAVADANSVYESGLLTGTDPGNTPIVATGNLLANDDGISSTTSITQMTFDGVTKTPVSGVVTFDTPEGLLTVYTTTASGHVEGDYEYTLQTAGDPVMETFSYRMTDTATGITTDNTLTINVVDDVHILNGTSGVDTLTGGNYTDFIDAKAGNDTLFGGLGPDTLIGGLGSDSMSGGAGQDTFVWKSGDGFGAPTDTITDFTKGSGGDVLDLADLLSGESQTAQSLDSFLNISYNNTTNATTIAVDADGGATFNVTQNIVLAGVDLTAGGTLNSDQDILTTMINNGNIKTDGG